MLAKDIKQTTSLYQQVTEWAEEQGWTVTPEIPYDSQFPEKTGLSIETNEGRIHLEPVGKQWNGHFRVNLYAYPTLLNVRLIKEMKSKTWQVVTDSGIPFHWDWNKDNFVRLVHDIQQVP